MKPLNVLVCCTGSVAAIKLPVILQLFKEQSNGSDVSLKVCSTEKALHFFDADEVKQFGDVYTDASEWNSWKGRGDPVVHIELSKWADVLVIAPLDANTLAKISSGICDNMLTCVVRAWSLTKPLFFCPAMNTYMWDHPITSSQISTLKSWGYIEIPCIEKTLMCGDTGLGAMAEPIDIVASVLKQFR